MATPNGQLHHNNSHGRRASSQPAIHFVPVVISRTNTRQSLRRWLGVPLPKDSRLLRRRRRRTSRAVVARESQCADRPRGRTDQRPTTVRPELPAPCPGIRNSPISVPTSSLVVEIKGDQASDRLGERTHGLELKAQRHAHHKHQSEDRPEASGKHLRARRGGRVRRAKQHTSATRSSAGFFWITSFTRHDSAPNKCCMKATLPLSLPAFVARACGLRPAHRLDCTSRAGHDNPQQSRRLMPTII